MGQTVSADAQAAKDKAADLTQEDKPQTDDVTLARKVETKIFRDSDIPKGRITSTPRTGRSSCAARSRSPS